MGDTLLTSLQNGDRRALAQAMTLVESTREDHRQQADQLLEEAYQASCDSIRIGISGSPGVGKSTFIEAFGSHLIEQGHKVAVLAVDPTSPFNHGSILADKTRMPKLSTSNRAFIRPSPSAGTLGGVAARTREVITLCEAAGFDIILIETVGVGQSEITVSHLSDMVLLLLPPAGGDELQGIKKGIVEVADLVLVNKCDGDLKTAGEQAVSHYRHALSLVQQPSSNWSRPTEGISSATNQGMKQVWNHVQEFVTQMKASPHWISRRRQQRSLWLEDTLKEELWQHFQVKYSDDIAALKSQVTENSTSPVKIAHEFVHKLFK